MIDAHKIAAGLTAAQRDALLAFPDALNHAAMPCSVKSPNGTYRHWGCTPAALVRKGLFTREKCNPVSSSGSYFYGPTSLGIAVRAIIQEQDQ